MASRKTTVNPHGERLASIEAMFAAHASADAVAFAELKAQVAATHALVEQLGANVNKRTSFVTGVVFAVSTIWAVIIAGVMYFKP